MKERIYKAQWPLSTTEHTPMIIIYPDDTRSPWYELPATKEAKKTIFANTFIKVYFKGTIKNGQVIIDKFVRRDEWL